jgi:RimJ/RimL family protein N-acetyltransferase
VDEANQCAWCASIEQFTSNEGKSMNASNQLLRLVPIQANGTPGEPLQLSDIAQEAAAASVAYYQQEGFSPPWCSYFSVVDGECVGVCAYKTPPIARQVEIAYFTFPAREGRGFATQAAAQLVALARATMPDVQIIAQTLPEANASCAVLKKNGFVFEATVEHPQDGTVWQWRWAGHAGPES